MKNILIVCPFNTDFDTFPILTYDAARDYAEMHEAPEHRIGATLRMLMDKYLKGDIRYIVDLRPFFAPSGADIGNILLNSLGIIHRLCAMKNLLFCGARRDNQVQSPVYAAMVYSLLKKDTPIVAIQTRQGHRSIMRLPADFTAAVSAYRHRRKKDFSGITGKDWLGGATFKNGHLAGDLETMQSTIVTEEGKCLIDPLPLDYWVPCDASNPTSTCLSFA